MRSSIVKRYAVSIVTVLLAAGWIFLVVDVSPGHKELKAYLVARLTEVKPEQALYSAQAVTPDTPIYILGGSQDSLKLRFETVAELCSKKPCGRVLLASQPGITGYDLTLKRNLTNDEWAAKQLSSLGIRNDRVEFVRFEKGRFGTMSEAKGLADLAASRGYKGIVLVTSQCHTKRTWLTFSRIFNGRRIGMSIFAAKDPKELDSLVFEYLKLSIYKNIILPNYTKTSTSVRLAGRP